MRPSYTETLAQNPPRVTWKGIIKMLVPGDWSVLWRGQLIYRTDFTQLKWLFHIINQHSCLPCKANKWRNKFSPQLKHVLQLGGCSMVLQECVCQGLSGLRCRSRIHAVQLGCSLLPFWCGVQPGSDREIHCGGQQWEHPWACLVPLARVKWGTSLPSGGAWGTEEQAQQPPKPNVSYPGHEQSCLQGAELRVQIHEHFCYWKEWFLAFPFLVLFKPCKPYACLGILTRLESGRLGLKLPLPAGTGLWAAGAAPVCCGGVGSTEHRPSLQTAPSRQTRCMLAQVPFPVLNTLHQGVNSKQINPLPLHPDSSKSLGNW